jgi:hypothetical protein
LSFLGWANKVPVLTMRYTGHMGRNTYLASCSTWLRHNNNNTTSRIQNTTIPQDGNILETFRR